MYGLSASFIAVAAGFAAGFASVFGASFGAGAEAPLSVGSVSLSDVTTGASCVVVGVSSGGRAFSVSQLIVNSAILAGERPQQLPPIAGVALMNEASASAPAVAISNGFLMDGLPVGGIADLVLTVYARPTPPAIGGRPPESTTT